MNTKAISPVIATVIIVSVAIAIAVAVAFWMTGITGLFTRYEKLEIVNAYATYNDTSKNYTVYLSVRNSGTTDATIDNIFINGRPLNTFDDVLNVTVVGGDTVYTNKSESFTPISIPAGEIEDFVIILKNNDEFNPGQIIEVKLHTAAGNEYPKSVQLP